MNFSPIGDIAHSLMMRRQGNSLRQELSALTQELATGKTRNLASSLRGNFSSISAVEHSIKLQDGFSVTRRTAEQILSFSQQSIGSMQTLIDEIGTPLLAATSSGTGVQSEPFVARGPDLLRDLVSYANTQRAGRYVFAGVESGTKPVADAETMLAEISIATAGAVSAVDFSNAIDDWFENPAAGFQMTGYNGGDPASGRLDISTSQSVAFETTAKDQAFRDAFKNAATIALVNNGEFSGSTLERTELLQSAATGLIDASSGLVAIQAEIGASQQRIETANSQSSLELQMLNSVKNDIISADPYEVATRLEAAQTQLEALYLVTAKTSRLNLSEYLR
jgi:flagellar hook-associated protein 3 FlgL